MPQGNKGRRGGQGGGLIQRNPFVTARNNDTGLPKVSGGIQASPKNINALSAGVQKTTVRSFVGGLVRNSTGGTTIEVQKQNDNHPFKVSVSQGKIIISGGNVWQRGSKVEAPIQKYYPNATTEMNVPSTGAYQFPDGSISVVTGEEITNSNEKGSSLVALGGSIDPEGVVVEMNTFGIQIKSLSAGSETNTEEQDFGIPIAVVKNGIVLQILKSDIWHPPDPLPLTLNVTGNKTDGYKGQVAAGSVNIKVPTINGKDITDKDARLDITPSTEDLDVYIKCLYSDPLTEFPVTAEVVTFPKSSPPTTAGNEAYLRLARVQFDEESRVVAVFNFLRSSISAEAYKYSTGAPPTFYFYSR